MTAIPYRVMRLALFGLQRGREIETGRGWWWWWEGVSGLYCIHCEWAALWTNGDSQHHHHPLIVSQKDPGCSFHMGALVMWRSENAAKASVIDAGEY